MKKRLISIILLLSLILGILSGCTIGGGEDTDKDEVEYKISLDKNELTMKLGETRRLTATVTPEPEEKLNITWKSSNENVITVRNGTVISVSAGTAVVDVFLDNGETDYCIVTVEADEEEEDSEEDKDPEENPEDPDDIPGEPGGSGGEITPPIAGLPVYNGGPVTISFYHTMGAAQREILDAAISRFNELYPDITVEHQNMGGSYDDLFSYIKVRLSVGEAPDLAYCYPDHVATYNMADAVVGLDAFIGCKDMINVDGNRQQYGFTDEQLADINPAFLNEGRAYDELGTTYSLPFLRSTEVMYYNKTFFEENDLTLPATWEEMEVLCEAIKQIAPASTPLCIDSESNLFITLASQYNSPIASLDEENPFCFDNDTNKQFVKMLRRWYDNGYFATMEMYGSYISSVFVNRGCYMAIGSMASAVYYVPESSFEVGVAPVPQVDPNNPKYISQGPSLCMFDNKDPQRVAAAWLFMKFLTTDTQLQAELSMASKYLPVISSVYDDPDYSAFLSKTGNDYISAVAINTVLKNPPAEIAQIPPVYGAGKLRYQLANLLLECLRTPTSDTDGLIDEKFSEAMKELE